MSNKILTRQDLATAYFASDPYILCHKSSEGLILVEIHVKKPGALNDEIPVWIAYSRSDEKIENELIFLSIFNACSKENPENLGNYIDTSDPDTTHIRIKFDKMTGLNGEIASYVEFESEGETGYLKVLLGNSYVIDKGDDNLQYLLLYILLREIGPIDPFLKAVRKEFAKNPLKILISIGHGPYGFPDLSLNEAN